MRLKFDRHRLSNWLVVFVFMLSLGMGYYLQRVKQQSDRYRDHATVLQYAIDHMSSGVVVVDLDGTVQEWRGAAEELTGWKEADVVGKPINYLMPEEYREAHTGYLLSPQVRASLKEVTLSLDCQILTKQKDFLPVHLRISTTRTDPELFLIILDRSDRLKHLDTVAPVSEANPKATRSFSDVEKS